MTDQKMEIRLLESGYWHARWSREVWAQWPQHQIVLPEDFFHHTASIERVRQIEAFLSTLLTEGEMKS